MTIKEIAALANVSVSTVSKIINGKDSNISPATRDKVLKIAKDYHYEPYSTVKSISAPKKFLIGLLLNFTSNISSLLGGILKASQEHGYQLGLQQQRSARRRTKAHHSPVQRPGRRRHLGARKRTKPGAYASFFQAEYFRPLPERTGRVFIL